MRNALAVLLLASSARAAVMFPSAEKILGASEDPLAGLTAPVAEDDLRDAVMSPPSSAWLMGGLRAADPASRLAAIGASAQPRNTAAIPHLRGVLLRLDEKPEVRAAAAVALGRIGDRLGAPALAEALGDPVPEVRYAAALALGRVPVDGATTRLTRSLRADPAWMVRYAAAIALGRARKEYAAGALEDRLVSDPVWQVRLQAVRSLQDIGGPRAAASASVALRDRDSGVRAAAALALQEIGGDAELVPLREALRVETDSSTRAVLSAAFRRVLARP